MKTKPIELTIVKKTTKNVTFTVKNENRELVSFSASNGIGIMALSYPSYDTYLRTLYAQGSAESLDDNQIKVSVQVFKEISAAVAEYNEKFGEKPMSKPADKLSLKIEKVSTNSTSGVVAFKIMEQSGFKGCVYHTFNGVSFVSAMYPFFHSFANTLCLRGSHSEKDSNIICVTTAEFAEIEAAIKLLNDSSPKFIEKITFLYTKDGTKTRRCLSVIKKTADSYEGIDEDKGEYRKFLKSKMSKIEVIK